MGVFPNDGFGLIGFYNYMFDDRGIKMPAHLEAVAHAAMDARIDKLLVTIGPGSGKALHPDTRILCRRGWVRIGDATAADEVMTPYGTWAQIRAVMPQRRSRLYRFEFANGTIIRAHKNHIWKCQSTLGAKVDSWVLRESDLLHSFISMSSYSALFVPTAYPAGVAGPDRTTITDITRELWPAPSVCINIDHPDGLFIAEGYVVTHNSTLLSTVLPAFRLGQDPTITQLGISAGEALIQGFQRGVMEWIADSQRWKAAFPHVTPDKVAGWSTARGLFVTGHLPGDPDANYAAFGIDSSKLTGVHARAINLDDVHDKDNSKTSESCLAVRRIYYSTILGRADPQGCKFIAAGRRWHEDDLYGHLAASGEWVHMNLPAFRDGETDLRWDVTMPVGLSCYFTD